MNQFFQRVLDLVVAVGLPGDISEMADTLGMIFTENTTFYTHTGRHDDDFPGTWAVPRMCGEQTRLLTPLVRCFPTCRGYAPG